ncbi:unnamed protein product [Jaminaea pallidilutea]
MLAVGSDLADFGMAMYRQSGCGHTKSHTAFSPHEFKARITLPIDALEQTFLHFTRHASIQVTEYPI